MPKDNRFYPLYWIALSGVVLVLDYATGPAIQFPITFVIPVALSTWYSGKIWGAVLAVLLAAGRVVMHLAWQPSTDSFILAVNSAIRVCVLVGIVLLVDQAAKLTREIKTLRGILPTCSSCKKIRTEGGEWKEMEVYISERTEAQFSHGVCKECAARLYPQYLRKMHAR